MGAFNGEVRSQDGNVGAVVMDSFVGTLNAGQDAWMIGEGNLLIGGINAGDDAGVYLYGDVNGSVVAENHVDVFTYGTFTGSIIAGEDVVRVYALGGIYGSIVAERGSIGTHWSYWHDDEYAGVLSHGSIDATISALGANESVGSVIAWGPIDGTITAGHSVGVVRSAASVNAVITPEGSVIENDSSVITQFPISDIPDSIVPELLAYRATTLANWEEDTTESRDQMQQIREEVELAIEATYNALAELEAEIRDTKSELESELDTAKTESQTAFLQTLDDLRSSLLQQQKDLIGQVESDRQAQILSRTRKIEAGEAAWQKSLGEAQLATAKLAQALESLSLEGQKTKLEFAKDADKTQDWVRQGVDGVLSAINPMNMLKSIGESWAAAHRQVLEHADTLGYTGAKRAYFYAVNMAPLVKRFASMYYGEDIWTLKKMDGIDRILEGASIILDVASVLFPVLRVRNFFTAPCRAGWVFGKCFTGDTPVVIAELPHGSSVAFAGVQVIPDDESASFGNLCLILGVGAGILTLSNRRKKKATQRTGGRGSLPGMPHVPLEVPPEPDLTPELDELYGSPTSPMLDASVPATSSRSLLSRQNPLLAERPVSAVREQVTPTGGGTEVREDVPVAAVEESSESDWKATGTIASGINQEHQPVTSEPTTMRSGRSLSAVMGLLSIALICLGIFFKGQSTTGSAGPQLLAAATASERSNQGGELGESPVPQFLTIPISDLEVMHHRVMAHNPLRAEVTEELGEINPEDWRVVTVEHVQPDGSKVTIIRGVPFEEIESEQLAVGRVIDVSMPENGIEGEFIVQSISSCPVPAEGEGSLVTCKFIHENAQVCDLKLQGSEETIGVTKGHLFWNVNRKAFVPIGEFVPGEQLDHADGTVASIQSLTSRTSRETVYNLEVNGEHVYQVGASGILVHNKCHGNSRRSRKSNHVYKIIDTRTGEIYKIGISGGKIGKNGSYRAINQVNRMNNKNPGRFRHEILKNNLTRSKALSMEQGLVTAFAKARKALTGLFEGPLRNKRPGPDRAFD